MIGAWQREESLKEFEEQLKKEKSTLARLQQQYSESDLEAKLKQLEEWHSKKGTMEEEWDRRERELQQQVRSPFFYNTILFILITQLPSGKRMETKNDACVRLRNT